MANPINEKIALAVLARMQSITTANSYDFDAVPVRYTPTIAKRGPRYQDHLLVLYEGEETIEPDPPQQDEQKIKAFRADYYIVESESSSTAIDQRLNIGAANIEKAITADTASVHTGPARQWDELASNTFMNGQTRFDPGEGGSQGISIFFNVQYRHDEDDPFTQS